jgi:hypothetical protein
MTWGDSPDGLAYRAIQLVEALGLNETFHIE